MQPNEQSQIYVLGKLDSLCIATSGFFELVIDFSIPRFRNTIELILTGLTHKFEFVHRLLSQVENINEYEVMTTLCLFTDLFDLFEILKG
jgi:hypothetical protein